MNKMNIEINKISELNSQMEKELNKIKEENKKLKKSN
jgi:hypothetical protein